jgi:hypothetical protein
MNETGTTVELRVPYTKLNIERCRCPQCPVQADSLCAQGKTENLKNETNSLPGNEALEPQIFPGAYCSAGDATCRDLDPNQQCICKTCAVWAEYVLETAIPMMYFCNNGRAT